MTATEDEIATAQRDGELAAIRRLTPHLVNAEIRAHLRGRHPNPDAVTEYLDHAQFVTANGDVDVSKCQEYAEVAARSAVPETFPDLGLGRRELPARPPDMNHAIRVATGVLRW